MVEAGPNNVLEALILEKNFPGVPFLGPIRDIIEWFAKNSATADEAVRVATDYLHARARFGWGWLEAGATPLFEQRVRLRFKELHPKHKLLAWLKKAVRHFLARLRSKKEARS